MPDISTECVLVVPTRLFHELGHFHGFSRDVDRYLEVLLDPANTSYRPRDEVEEDPSFKQLIPYCIFRHVDADRRESVFQYTRGRGQGEARLHAKRSIGIGGHISADDASMAGELDPYEEGLRRELAEEVHIDTPYRRQSAGLINDDETDVGKVHLGIVYLFDVEEPAVRPRESEIIEAGFRTVDELLVDSDRFESWSQICLETLFGSQT